MFKYYSHNILKIGLLITATQFLMASGCNKDSSKPCAMLTPYSFKVTSEFTPQKEVYNVGDTIYLTSTFPKTLTNLISYQQVDYSNSVGILGDVSIFLLDSTTKQPIPGRDSFLLTAITGNFLDRRINQNQGVNTSYKENSSYEFRGGFICKNKGIYGFGVQDLGCQGLVGKNCTNAGFNMTVTNTNKHLNLYATTIGSNPNDPILQRIGYAFRVQ
jgi:hypothetical protein